MSTPERVTAVFYDHASLWTGTDDDAGHTTDGGRVFGITRRRYVECDHYKCPAVVVIDPEDREQVERLLEDWWRRGGFGKGDSAVDNMQAALRSLTADPKPDEPQGLGAVVEDVEGRWWSRVGGTTAMPWHHGIEGFRSYADVTAVRVLSEGVQ